MQRLREVVRDVEWESGLKVWGKVYTFSHPIAAVPDEIPESLGEPFIVSRERQTKKPKNKKVTKDKFQKEREQNRKVKEIKKSKQNESLNSDEVEAGDAGKGVKMSGKSDKILAAENAIAGQFDDVEDDDGKDSAAAGDGVNVTGDKKQDIIATEVPDEGSSVDDVKLQEKVESSVSVNSELPEEKQDMPADVRDATMPKESIKSEDGDLKADDKIHHTEGEELTTQSAQDIGASENEDRQSQPESSATGTDEETPEEKGKKKVDPTKPTFRVTCNRTGEGHSFDSMCAAANFGDAVQTYFGWNVDMKNFDIEVILNIEDRDVSVGIGLTKQSLHRRNLSSFGPTTLRPTIAYNMLR